MPCQRSNGELPRGFRYLQTVTIFVSLTRTNDLTMRLMRFNGGEWGRQIMFRFASGLRTIIPLVLPNRNKCMPLRGSPLIRASKVHLRWRIRALPGKNRKMIKTLYLVGFGCLEIVIITNTFPAFSSAKN